MKVRLFILLVMELGFSACSMKNKPSEQQHTPAEVNSLKDDLPAVADQHLLSFGIDPMTKKRSVYQDSVQWMKQSLTDESSPYLRDMVETLPMNQISVVSYGSREHDLGGVVIVFINKKSRTVVRTYRGK